MTGRKVNIYAWCLLALAVIGCVSMAVGITYARYREDVPGAVEIGLRKNEQLFLMAGKTPENATAGAAHWDGNGNIRSMEFLITNTPQDGKAPKADQTCTLRLAASLDVWDGVSQLSIVLSSTQGESAQILQGQLSRIEPDTVLHREFGDGWLIIFVDERGNEKNFKLEGGQNSWISMELLLESEQAVDTALIQLMLEGRMLPE